MPFKEEVASRGQIRKERMNEKISQIKKNDKLFFKWGNGDIQRVYACAFFTIKGEPCIRAKMTRRWFVLKESDYGKTWALTKEELEKGEL